VAEFDQYVKAIQDLLGQLGAPAERLRAMEAAMGRFVPTAGSAKPAMEFASELAAMPERIRELGKLLVEFGSPAAQLRSFEEQLAITRQQLVLMAQQLEGAEKVVARFATLAEQLAELQQPFSRAATAWFGPDLDADAADVSPEDAE
jgi:DNA repair ATPase RecN